METRLYFYGDAFTSIMKQPYNTFTTILRLITNKITTILRTRLGFLQQPLSSMATSHVVVRLLQTCEFAVDLLLLQTAFPLMRFTCRRRKSRHRRSEKKGTTKVLHLISAVVVTDFHLSGDSRSWESPETEDNVYPLFI